MDITIVQCYIYFFGYVPGNRKIYLYFRNSNDSPCPPNIGNNLIIMNGQRHFKFAVSEHSSGDNHWNFIDYLTQRGVDCSSPGDKSIKLTKFSLKIENDTRQSNFRQLTNQTLLLPKLKSSKKCRHFSHIDIIYRERYEKYWILSHNPQFRLPQ